MNAGRRLMGWGLRVLNRVGGSPLLDDPARREQVTRAVKGMTTAGFRLATTASRAFRAERRPGGPLRPQAAAATGLFDLTPSDEQQMIRDSVASFAAEQLRPQAQAADSACLAPPALLAGAAELGLSAMQVPEAYSGAAAGERSVMTNALVAEALAQGDLGLAAACLSPVSVAIALAEWGSAGQQARYLPAFAGERPPMASLAVMEPRPLFDPFQLQTEAVRGSDGSYRINGEKSLVLMAAQAELFLVAARTAHGPQLFILESSTPGLSLTAEPAMGLRACATARLQLKDVQVPASALLGEGSGDFRFDALIARSRMAWSALAVGTAQAVLDYVIPYVNDRTAFGEPISHRQAVAFAVSNIALETEGMRLLTWRAASRCTQGLDFAREAALARRLCADKGAWIGSEGVQLLGGHGFVKEHPVERWYRDLRAAGVMEGGLLL